ncbi:2-oxo-3-methylvalerate dehydrogenase E1 component subunit alpha [Halogeometricum pallidum JCM 14848]|uniref:2-oxo-3-methylvalerate dehydrogenase E1 component subunit alpha n=1 Tax=Halogeometricum pallidum JCM 14848 TaxID=1227487 RepID=M0DBF6_HALPD|nr:thiamine pyrophosphate-dependent dehydrogenase E1 component subunit alpha [Halogeometricum pallidum]ELZ32830.1 2-oxo-3-methylvalerate dehydrogenase E1 component subunit alpha [Halogeometricum pallidum JCM 14848]
MDGKPTSRPSPRTNAAAGVEHLSQADLRVETHQVVTAEGTVDEARVPDLADAQFRDLYRWLVLQRTFDERATKLQRRGQLGTYASGRGQEASIVGSAFALADDDWIFPAGREAAALLMHGVSMRDLLLYWRGVEDASRMEGANVFGVAIAIGSQMPMVTGKAWGMQLAGDDAVAVGYFGDGATSTGAFHEGVNFAGVLEVPAVFYCQNNQYAISLPFAEQTGADTVAQKALAYGVDGIRVDGNDVLAVYNAVSTARARAREGRPVLVESVTYRRGAHTTSDDPTRYREEEEVESWAARDPLDRYRTFLGHRDLLDGVDEVAVREEVDAMFDEAVAAADDYPLRDVDEIFVHLYEELTPELARQMEWYRDFLDDHPEMDEYVHQRERG